MGLRILSILKSLVHSLRYNLQYAYSVAAKVQIPSNFPRFFTRLRSCPGRLQVHLQGAALRKYRAWCLQTLYETRLIQGSSNTTVRLHRILMR